MVDDSFGGSATIVGFEDQPEVIPVQALRYAPFKEISPLTHTGQPTLASPPATSPTTAHPPIYSAVVPGQPGGPQAAGVEGAAIRPRL